MARDRRMLRFEMQEAVLEARTLLSQAGTPVVAAMLPPAPPPSSPLPDVFHRNGINGLKIHKSFDVQMNDRFSKATQSAHLVFEAFEVFELSYFQRPSTPPIGNPAQPPTLPNLLADMSEQVAVALSTFQIRTNQVGPSLVRAPKFTLRPFDSLIAYSQAQIITMGNTLSTLPPHGGAKGSASAQAALDAINRAYNAIYNALAEYTVHPNLFVRPSDFYISPDVSFTINFDGNPAKAGPGYFVRGPGGQILPGATLHPHFPLKPVVG